MYLRSGMGVLNPTAASSQLNCGFFSGGVFQKACWCLDWPDLCSTSDYQAAVGLAYPEAVYSPIKAPPVVGAPAGDTPPQSTTDALLAQQMVDWQAQNQVTMAETQANLDRVAANKPTLFGGNTNWLLLAALGIGAVVLLGGRR